MNKDVLKKTLKSDFFLAAYLLIVFGLISFTSGVNFEWKPFFELAVLISAWISGNAHDLWPLPIVLVLQLYAVILLFIKIILLGIKRFQ